MKLAIKKWDLSDTGNFIDLIDFAPNFGKRHLETMGEDYLPFLEKDIIAQTIRWQLAKQRSGNASTKTRSDVSGTTRKPWGQKETGKARQGSLRAPHFRGGGVVFGPHPRSYEYKLNKKFKKLALGLTINSKIKSEDLIVFDSFESGMSKTKEFVHWMGNSGFDSVLFVGDFSQEGKRSFSNVYGVDVLPLIGLNVLSCVKHKKIIFDVASMNGLVDRYSKVGVNA